MKKIANVLTISVVLNFTSFTSNAQESNNKIQELPATITQQRIEPDYKAPGQKATTPGTKPDFSLQAKPVAQQSNSEGNTQKDDEIIQPVALKSTPAMANSITTIDNKTNTDKYYNQKPILPVEPPNPVNKQIIKEKPVPNQVPVILQNN